MVSLEVLKKVISQQQITSKSIVILCCIFVVLALIGYFVKFSVALSILLFLGGIYHIYIISKFGVKKEDFTQQNIITMEKNGATSLCWLIFSIVAIFFLSYNYL